MLVAHGGALFDGLFLDDHWHRTTLRTYGWGFSDLIDAGTFEIPGNIVHHWWQEQPLRVRLARPVAMLLMKVEYVVSGGNPIALHAFGLAWHWGASLLVYVLASAALRHRALALLAAVLFAIQPHSVFTVGWIAAQNALQSVFFLLAAVLLYLRASHGRIGALSSDGLPDPPPLRMIPFVLSLLLAACALFCRESAIVFPVLIIVMDAAVGGRPLLMQRLPAYAAIGVLAAVYLYWRLLLFPEAGPPSIYFKSPEGPGYALWAAAKLAHLLVSLFLHFPMLIGLATYEGVSPRHTALLVALCGVTALLLLWYMWASRGLRTRAVWPVWLIVGFIPVIPVVMMPQFAYLPAVAGAIMQAVVVASLPRKPGIALAALLIIAHLWSLGVYRVLWRGVVRSEQLIYADILANNPRPPEGTSLCLINLPVVGMYGSLPLREAWDCESLAYHVLTYADHPLRPLGAARIERVGERELVVAASPPGFFAGFGGRMLLDSMRPDAPLEPGMTIPGDLFETTVLEADERGVTRLKFRFRQPLDSPDLWFFVSTAERPAARLRFGPHGSIAVQHEPGGWRRRYRAWFRARAWFFRIADFVRDLSGSDLFLAGSGDGSPR